MANKQVVNSKQIDIDVPVEREKIEPMQFEESPIPPEIDAMPEDLSPEQVDGLSQIDAEIQNAIFSGDEDRALKMINAVMARQDMVERFRKNLMPEAYMADSVRRFRDVRQGRQPAQESVRSGVFRGEQRSPEEIERTGQQDRAALLRDFLNVNKTMQQGALSEDKILMEANSVLRALEQADKQYELSLSEFDAKRRETRALTTLKSATEILTQIEVIRERNKGNLKDPQIRKNMQDLEKVEAKVMKELTNLRNKI